MSSTFGGFETAKSGLSVSMQQLNVTEHNITNVNTAGYTRERLLISAKEPASSKYLIAQTHNNMIGQGVQADGVQQIRSAYLDQQFRNLNSSYNYESDRNQALTYLDGLYNELDTESGLTTSIENYFSALKDFAQDPTSKANRTALQQQALSMTETFNGVSAEMVSLWNDQNTSISTTAQQINSIAEKIAKLNDSIARSAQITGTANDLNDQRNLLLDELSGYVNITYNINTTNQNMVDVQIGGVSLVDGRTANNIGFGSISDLATQVAKINADVASGKMDDTEATTAIAALSTQYTAAGAPVAVSFDTTTHLGSVLYNGTTSLVTGSTIASMEVVADGDLDTWIDLNRSRLTLGGTELSNTVGGDITSGSLYSNMEMTLSNNEQSPGIPFYMNQLNELARDIAKNINDIHQTGFTYPDASNSDTSTDDVIFFNAPVAAVQDAIPGTDYDYTKVNAGNFTLSQDVLDSVYNIAGSSQIVSLSTDPVETGNGVIAEAMFLDLQNHSYYDKLNSLVNNLAIVSSTSTGSMDTRKSLLSSVDTQRTSLSGVSLDEETTNLIIFQQSYNAAARIITTLDSMLDTMINNMGLVGR